MACQKEKDRAQTESHMLGLSNWGLTPNLIADSNSPKKYSLLVSRLSVLWALFSPLSPKEEEIIHLMRLLILFLRENDLSWNNPSLFFFFF